MEQCISEKIQNITDDMKQLLEDMNNADAKNINIEQIKQLGLFCRNFAIDIQELIYDLKNKGSIEK